MTVEAMLKRPSAFLPVAMSGVAVALLLGALMTMGLVHHEDEGALAHIWQLLMASQLPIVGFFALSWLPRAPKPASVVLLLQVAAALAAAAPVFLLGL